MGTCVIEILVAHAGCLVAEVTVGQSPVTTITVSVLQAIVPEVVYAISTFRIHRILMDLTHPTVQLESIHPHHIITVRCLGMLSMVVDACTAGRGSYLGSGTSATPTAASCQILPEELALVNHGAELQLVRVGTS
mmetsp:Transcript_52132/g.96507  ORF Transcript_52132/g.96507 Transcript_52132/m.96507 type:complete len:135 (-) Transcript_52132:449-853(-)